MLSGRELEGLEAIVSRFGARKQKYIPHDPTPKQEAFLGLNCLEALYGGAAGGGKSDALLMAALQYVHVPGYAALILRRTFQDLMRSDAIMARADEWLRGTDAKWKAETRTWHFPSGATLSFGYFDTVRDRDAYQGGAWQFIAFDETTQFPESWYRYLFSRLRRTHQRVPLRMRSASNPGGIGHDWVYRRFINPGTEGCPFVPAKLDDNPYVDATSYRESLDKLDSTTRQQLLEGVWTRDAEGLVYRLDDKRNIIAEAPECQKFVLGIDYGTRSPTAFVVLGWRVADPTVYVLRAWKESGLSPSAAAERVKALQTEFKFSLIVGDTGGLGAGYVEEARDRFKLPIEAAEKQNKLGYIKLLNGDLERGRVRVVRAACESLLSEWLELPWHETADKEAPGFDNHCADACLYGWRAAWAHYASELDPAAPVQPDSEAHAQKVTYLENLRKDRERRERWGRLPATHAVGRRNR